MKILFYPLLLCAVSLPVSGQITLTSNDVGPFNRKIALQVNDNNPVATPGASGANATWTFGNLGFTYVDTMTFIDPQQTPYFAQYPSADISMVFSSSIYGYGTLDNSAFRIIGQADNFSQGSYTFKYLKPETILQFPMTYQSSFKDTSSNILQMYLGFDPGIGTVVDSMRSISIVYKNITVDAHGSLTTTFGTYEALRLNNLQYTETINDYYINGSWVSAMPNSLDSSRVYSWWSNDIGAPLLELTEDLSTNTITESVMISDAQMILGMNDHPAVTSVNVYPNPATNILHINTEFNEYVVTLMDMQGRTIISENVASSDHVLDLSGVPSGVYILHTMDKENGNLRSERIIKGQ